MATTLTDKQKKFCDEYLVDLNVLQAALRAGYKRGYALKHSYEMLKNPLIREYIDKRMHDREVRTEITQDKVLKEIAAIAFSNPSNFFKIIDRPVMANGIPVLDENGKPKTFKDVEFTNTDDLSESDKKAVSSAKVGVNGLEVKLNDKIKALELLGRHLGMFRDKVEIKDDSDKISAPRESIEDLIEKVRSGNNSVELPDKNDKEDK